MDDPLNLNQESSFEGFLKWLSRPGYAARDVLKGNLGGAVRQVADFALDPIDAILPGDVLPSLSRQEDYTNTSDLLGGMEPGLAKTAVDIVGNTLLDPLTYTGVAPLLKLGATGAKAGLAAAKAVPALTKTVEGAETLGKNALFKLREGTGNLMPTPENAATVAGASAKGGATKTAAQGAAVGMFKNLSPEVQQRAIEAVRGVMEKPGAGYTDIDALAGLAPRTMAFGDKAEQMARIDARLSQMGLDPAIAPDVRNAAEQIVDFTRGQWTQGVSDKVFQNPDIWMTSEGKHLTNDRLQAMYGLAQGEAAKMQRAADRGVASLPTGDPFLDIAKQAKESMIQPQSLEEWAASQGYKRGAPTADMAPLDYLPGKYELEQAAKEAAGSGIPNPVHAKSILSSSDLASYLNTNKARLDTDLPALLGDYGARMGQAAKAAELGQKIAPEAFKALSDPASRSAVKAAIDGLETAGKRDDAAVLRVAYEGLPPREGIWKILSNVNSIFKPFATGGAFLPRPAFTTRNVLSGAAMVASNPEARGAALGQLARAPKDLIGAWSDGLRKLGLPLPPPEMETQIERAIAMSGGDREKFLAGITDPLLRGAVQHGVLDAGFATSEQMVASAAQAAKGMKDWRNLRDWPQGIVKGSEDRMRLGLYADLVQRGMPEVQAAKVVKDSLYDYAYSSTLNRNIRDVIPFFQFSAKAVPQQTKFLLESGAVPAVARNTIENLYSQGTDAILPPQLQDAAAVPLGRDAENNPEYLTSFGMPFESLAQIPNLTGNLSDIGPELRQNVISQTTPALKTLWSLVSGEDPYFGTQFASYDRAPYLAQALGADPNSEAARIYNVLAGSGTIQPIASTVSMLSGALDPRRSAAESALNTLTGVRIKSVDEQQALRTLLEEALKRDPSVQRYESLYQQNPDEATQRLLDELKRVKSEIRAKRKAAQ